MVPALLATLALAVPVARAIPSEPLPFAKYLVDRALGDERKAITYIPAKDSTAEYLLGQLSSIDLGSALHQMGLSGVSAPDVTNAISQAEKLDAEAVADLKAGKNRQALEKIGQANALKKRASAKLDLMLPATTAKTCEVEKPFEVFAIPAGYAGSYADVYPHGIPRGATNIKASFIDLATGKPPAADVFPGQTWTSTVKGFLPDGRFDVHVDVSGTGFGKPNANVKNWKVVVTFDCP